MSSKHSSASEQIAMNQPVCCPKCDQSLTAVGEFWICSQHGQISLETSLVSLGIFVSYGHDNNEELARQIKLSPFVLDTATEESEGTLTWKARGIA